MNNPVNDAPSPILQGFHPIVADWFVRQFERPSEVQEQAWPAIQAGQSTLIAAPTGSGKTLAAFLAVIDQLIKQGLENPLADETYVLYISPLKALSNDIRKNLEQPLTGIDTALLEAALPGVLIRAQTRTGDTTQAERTAMRKSPRISW
nr:DEAD/DEAH box helicase [Methylomarinum sp. Ch1-1]MDP4520323.1 DEAD/DEAH box helicase [Methylomarinum sp. Ch1-1]